MVGAGIEIVLCNRGAEDALAAAANALGPLATPGTMAEVTSCETVVAALPFQGLVEVLAGHPDWEARILIDATNPPVGNGSSHLDLQGSGSSELIASLADGAHVVKAFNSLPAALLARSPIEGDGRRVVFHSGDHSRANEQVSGLIATLGFAPIDLGPLARGILQQPGGSLWMQDLMLMGKR